MKRLSILGYVGMVGGLVGLLATRSLLSPAPLVVSVQAAAVLLLLWARVTFGRRSFHAVADPTEGGLVTGGPYRFIRHPIYTSVCLFTSAGVAAHISWGGGLCLALVWAGALVRVFCEEALLVARYPEYTHYQAKTWRMIPFVF